MTKPCILIVDGDPASRGRVRRTLFEDYDVIEASERSSAVELTKQLRPAVVITELGLPPNPFGPSEGLKTVLEILQTDRLSKVIAHTSLKEKGTAVKALDLGVFDYFLKPAPPDELRIMVKRAMHLYGIQREDADLCREMEYGPANMIGTSPKMQEVFRSIKKIASVNMPVLVLGESGTGKELAANAVHDLSDRKDKPFIVINCGAIPENLLETELFGYERGAFTGADTQKKGKVEYAEGGTLFLDEIGELSPKLQVKLLRFLQESTIERVGGRESLTVDARVISATNRDLKTMASEGTFREDLYFRLGVIPLIMPPLRERGDDVYTLALSFLRKFTRELNRHISGFNEAAVKAIGEYNWPGNIRELENKVKRAVALCKDREISPEDLTLPSPGTLAVKETTGLAEAKEAFKKRLVQEALLKNKGGISRSASDLGISRQYLSRLITKYNLKVK